MDALSLIVGFTIGVTGLAGTVPLVALAIGLALLGTVDLSVAILIGLAFALRALIS